MKFDNIYTILQSSSPERIDPLLEAKESDMYKPVKLPYELNSLEPFVGEETMSLHYNKHYKGYINKLNELISSRTPIEELVRNIHKNEKVRFNAGGMYNHQIFWLMLSPEKSAPKGELEEMINKKFGLFDSFKEKFIEKATSIMGSGWCWLVKKDGKLDIITTPNQDNPLMDNLGTPILGLDMWEHAYYKDYGPDKQKYVENFFKVINWNYCNILISAE